MLVLCCALMRLYWSENLWKLTQRIILINLLRDCFHFERAAPLSQFSLSIHFNLFILTARSEKNVKFLDKSRLQPRRQKARPAIGWRCRLCYVKPVTSEYFTKCKLFIRMVHFDIFTENSRRIKFFLRCKFCCVQLYAWEIFNLFVVLSVCASSLFVSFLAIV